MSKLMYALLLTVMSMVCLCSCKKDSSGFLKRNTDKLSFSYNESTATFTVRSTGPWTITIPEGSDWIKVSPERGTGDGTTYQTVQVTCLDNSGEAREGIIYLNGSGQVDVPVTINQANGVFEWLKYGNGSSFTLNDLLVKGSPSTASILIPYIKATGKEKIKATVSLSGKGASGLSVNTEALTLQAGDGNLAIPIMGTPTTQGQVDIEVKIDGAGFGKVSTITGIGQVLIHQAFDKFMWGGDCIANKEGITTTVPTASMTTTDPTIACSIGTNGANGSGVTSTIKNSNPSFYKAIGMENWSGVRNYMRPGYIQLGAASATGAEFGSLISPKLPLPTGNFDLLVSFKIATYNQPVPNELVVGLMPGNPTGVTVSNFNTITAKNILPVNIPMQKWVEYTCIIKNATNASGLVITLPESLANGGTVGAARIYVDDVKVSY
ncbi:BACON domain-containing protein [Arachidicoccus terrestris]|uniref:BACON domain-containing protein n=1 Tax=Arachidicoccus terrestris TaxID=2875539 RepID=UPI001CC6F56D|nr:BACON domain-containing protein [Arachidicoccus terrestris]UAY56956.1 BACON domain-containing protein [Arachidicoccus terrestris]